MSEKIGTKYPIVLLHGMGARDSKIISFWGRIPKKLRTEGNKVFFGHQDANGSVEDNAIVIKNSIEKILNETKAEKVNIIAHSKGGLDARYVISRLDMGDRIASLTTLSTPHHGSKSIDLLLKLPDFLIKFGCILTDIVMKIGGDKKPNTYKIMQSFSTEGAKKFNELTPNDERVYYQSYCFYMKHWYSDIFMTIPYFTVYLIEGQNDGLIVPDSAKWGEFKGLYCGNSIRGISHCDEVDMRRFRLTAKKGEHISDIIELYINIWEDLKNRGL